MHMAGTLAHLKTLVRTRTSDVSLNKCSPLDDVLSQLIEKKVITEVEAFHPLKDVATHLPSIEVTPKVAIELLQGYTQTVHSVIERANLASMTPYELSTSGAGSENNSHSPAKYVLVRLSTAEPVALLERTSESDSILNPSYRLQRVILRPLPHE